ncbi:MAG TPA: hypothetical protein VMV07_22505 [Streptosporangiaceae bacterium]|nr:hypothetical protein [Streptosporangiaceae bacterium]
MAKPKQPTDRLPKARPVTAPVQPVTTMLAPGSVRTAVKLMYAGAVLAALDLVITLTTVGKAESLLRTAHPGWTSAEITRTVHAEVSYFLVTWLVTIGLWVVMARTNQAGRGWARIVATILFVISTLNFAVSLGEPTSLVYKLVLVPMWLVGAGAVALLWRSATTEYIRSGRT